MTSSARGWWRDLAVAVAAVVAVGAWSFPVEAQRRSLAGAYAMEVDGSPGIMSISNDRANQPARGPAQPQAPTGLMRQEGLLLLPNSCVSQSHHVSAGQGLWRRVGRNGRSALGQTVHAFSSVPGGTAFTFQRIIWSFTVEIAGHGLRGDARVEYYDSLENLREGLPGCVSHDLEVRGWATFPN